MPHLHELFVLFSKPYHLIQLFLKPSEVRPNLSKNFISIHTKNKLRLIAHRIMVDDLRTYVTINLDHLNVPILVSKAVDMLVCNITFRVPG